MVVGQAPGRAEAETGIPFCGPSGRRLMSWLADAGWEEESFRRAQYITAVTKCYPGRNASGRGDRTPSRAERALCASFLERELALVSPSVIVPVGATAIASFLGRGSLDDRVGFSISLGNRIVVPLPHPSGANLWLSRPSSRRRLQRALAVLRALRGSESAGWLP